MNMREYAAHRGVARSAVRDAINRKRISAQFIKNAWHIDPEVADREWVQNTAHRGSDQVELHDTPAVTDEYPSITESRAKTEYYRAALSELEYRIRSERYVCIDDIKRQQSLFARTLRDRILGVPDRISNVLSAESDAQAIHVLLTDELSIALEEVANAVAGSDI